MAFARAERTAALTKQTGKFDEAILLRLAGVFGELAGKIAVVLRLHLAPVVCHNVAARANPIGPQRGQAFVRRPVETRIAPWPGAVIHAHRFVGFDGVVERRRREFDFAHRHTDFGMEFAGQVNAFGVGQLFAAVPVLRSKTAEGGQLEGIFGCNHIFVLCGIGRFRCKLAVSSITARLRAGPCGPSGSDRTRGRPRGLR